MNKLKETQVFTPPWATNQMLDMLNQDDFAKDETFYFEPSCGDGQMLEVIFERIHSALLKKHNGDPEKALAEAVFKFYAIELDEEMVIKARVRMFKSIWSRAEGLDLPTLTQYLIARSLQRTIEQKDFFKFMKPGTL